MSFTLGSPTPPRRLAAWLVLLTLALLAACAGEQRVEPAPKQRPAMAPAAQHADAGPPRAPRSSGAPSAAALEERDVPERVRPRIDLQPLGAALPEVDVAFVERSLSAFYAVDVRRLERIELPDSARNVARRRYRAEKLLDFLEGRRAAEARFVLGLTGADISTTKPPHEDWGILGLATLDGTVCVISSFRTHRLAKDDVHARIRLGKVAVHEVGHNLGLEHCPERGCLMEDARGTVLTTDREHDLCPRCRARLGAIAIPEPELELPWPRVEAP